MVIKFTKEKTYNLRFFSLSFTAKLLFCLKLSGLRFLVFNFFIEPRV